MASVARRRPASSSYSTPPPGNGGSVIYGYADLPVAQPSPKEGQLPLHMESPRENTAPSTPPPPPPPLLTMVMAVGDGDGDGGDGGDDDKKKKKKKGHSKKSHHPKGRPYRSKFRVMGTLFLINLAVILLFVYLRLPQRDLAKMTAVVDFLKQAHRILGDEYVVLVTASTTHAGGHYVRMGRSNETAVEALNRAIRHLPVHHRMFRWFKIDYIVGMKRLENFDYFRPFSPQFGDWYGIALGWDEGIVFLPDQVRAHCFVDRAGFLRWERLVLWMQKHKPHAMTAMLPDYGDDTSSLDVIDLFHTKSIFIDMTDTHHRSTSPVIPLDHGHRKFDGMTLQPYVLHEAAISAGKFLLQDTSGNMVAYYKPRSHYIEYNNDFVELWYGTALTMIGLAQLHSAWRDPHLLGSIQTGIHTIKPRSCRLANGNQIQQGECLIQSHGASRLSTNAMFLLALVEYFDTTNGDRTFYDTMERVANYIEASYLGQTNQIFIQQILYTGQEVKIDSEYEENDAESLAAFALARLCNVLDKHRIRYRKEWRELAFASVDVLVVQQADQAETDHAKSHDFIPDPWLLHAIAELYRAHRHTSPMVEYASKAAMFPAKFQIQTKPPDNQHPHLMGSFYHDSSGVTSAALSLGLCRIYSLLPEKRKQIKRSLELSAQFQLQLQIRPETALYLKDPQRILGGIHEALDSLDMSNIGSALTIMSFLCMSEIF